MEMGVLILMNNLAIILPKVPLDDWIEALVAFLKKYFTFVFKTISSGIETLMKGLVSVLSIGPPYVLIIVLALLSWFIVNWRLGLFTLIGLGLLVYLCYWSESIDCIGLIVIFFFFYILIGVMIGS